MENNTYLSIEQMITKLGNRSKSAILRDVSDGILPKPFKFGDARSKSYWIEAEVEQAISLIRGQASANVDEAAL